MENIEKGEYDLTNDVSLNFFNYFQKGIGIKPGNALPMYAANAAERKRKSAAGKLS